MFNVGGPEIVVILLVALVILGPDQLPKAMRTFGNVMAEIRKVTGGLQAEMHKAMEAIDTTGPSPEDAPRAAPVDAPRSTETSALDTDPHHGPGTGGGEPAAARAAG